MAKYSYPAIFTPEGNDVYSVLFPDIDGCYTFGNSLINSIEMAQDALALVLYGYEKDERPIPTPSKRNNLLLKEHEFVNYIVCDTMAYRKRFNNKAVKKTLTLPEWMNEEATAIGINFSQVLQEALLAKLQR